MHYPIYEFKEDRHSLKRLKRLNSDYDESVIQIHLGQLLYSNDESKIQTKKNREKG
jgi:hypothetical protein